MITINNMTTDIAGIDNCLAMGCIDHANPEISKIVSFLFSELTSDQQGVYASFFSLGDGRSWISIKNYDCVISIDHITSEVLVEEALELDYNSMSDADRIKIDAFRDMMESIIIE
jgi:hypothetical protein